MIEIKKLLRVAKESALLGGLVLKENFRRLNHQDVREKAEKDVVSYVDKVSEERIRDHIRRYFPDHCVVGEEGGGDEGCELVWFVDPLDGTKNYIMGFPVFATSVGLVYRGEPVVGAIYLPYFNTLYWAGKGMGAYKDGVRLYVSTRNIIERCSVAYGFPSRAERDLKVYWDIFRGMFDKVGSMRRPGAAAVDLCFLAEGVFDGLVEFELNPWDVCAGMVIVKEAGALVELTKGMSRGTDILAGTPYIFPFLKEVVNLYLRE